ncbi:glucuronate isomerase [Paenibacillus qinlingensis]|uniref:glucuronate isomerase n=1 Tax=Paenibacillus qinlingensis TaxID=1837343 RepID=UPI001563D86B|nr:glucuronate isomerase [Paenibacillus qinlingensis]NQX59427.1 glucuronate isomerase [Paenibacillus qinlingensis]
MNKQMKQGKEEFEAQIMQLPVVDTHTHLVGDRLCASDFWEIAHYFWLFRELQAAGYPANAMELPEDERIAAFLEAYHGSRNTMMNMAMTHIFRDLYGIVIRDAASVREADAAVKQSAGRATWAQEVADRLNVSRFVVNIPEHAEFQGMRENAILIPRIDGKIGGWVKEVELSPNPAGAFAQVREKLAQLLDTYKDAGYAGVMTTLPSYEASANRKVVVGQGSTKDEILMMLLHELGVAAEQRGLLIQLFLGVERSWCGTATPVNDPARILKLSALFEAYACTFELVVASELNNLDIVQAAWNFPNVHVGGHWWFNFRASTYRDSMQYRLEALPAIKSSLIVSDARCMEWSYGKIVLVKRIVSDFLWGQIEAGWINHDTAIYVAENWLYHSAAKRYGVAP